MLRNSGTKRTLEGFTLQDIGFTDDGDGGMDDALAVAGVVPRHVDEAEVKAAIINSNSFSKNDIVDAEEGEARAEAQSDSGTNHVNNEEDSGSSAGYEQSKSDGVSSSALLKRQAIQSVMQDRSLAGIERNEKIQDIIAGGVELSTFILDSYNTQSSKPSNVASSKVAAQSNTSDSDSDSSSSYGCTSHRRESLSQSSASSSVVSDEVMPDILPDEHDLPEKDIYTEDDNVGDNERDMGGNGEAAEVQSAESSVPDILYEHSLSIQGEHENEEPYHWNTEEGLPVASFVDPHWQVYEGVVVDDADSDVDADEDDVNTTCTDAIAEYGEKISAREAATATAADKETLPLHYIAGDDNISDVLDVIGIEIYKYLVPRELFHFSLASHHVHEEVSKGLIQSCLRQMPPNFGSEGKDHCITFNRRHSYYTKEMLLDQLLDKVQVAELKILGAEDQSMEDSLSQAREILTRKKAGARFISYNSELPAHLQFEYTSVGYNYDADNKKLAVSRSSYILSRMAMAETEDSSDEEEEQDNNNEEDREKQQKQLQHTPIVKTWIGYILSQRHIVAGTWFWSCRHRNLDFQGVEGKGVMISSPHAEGEEMEIMWTRLTASRV